MSDNPGMASHIAMMLAAGEDAEKHVAELRTALAEVTHKLDYEMDEHTKTARKLAESRAEENKLREFLRNLLESDGFTGNGCVDPRDMTTLSEEAAQQIRDFLDGVSEGEREAFLRAKYQREMDGGE